MSKKEKLIKELIDLIGEDRFTEEEKEDLKNLSEEDLELMVSLEKALAETSPTMEELLDKLPYQIWLKNEQKRYIYINKLGAEKLGLSREQIIGKSDYEFREYDIAEKCNVSNQNYSRNTRNF